MKKQEYEDWIEITENQFEKRLLSERGEYLKTYASYIDNRIFPVFWFRSFKYKDYPFLKTTLKPVSDIKIPFTRFMPWVSKNNVGCHAMGVHDNIKIYLTRTEMFVEKVIFRRVFYDNGFVRIDLFDMTIMHTFTLNPHRTKLSGNIHDQINYFKKI